MNSAPSSVGTSQTNGNQPDADRDCQDASGISCRSPTTLTTLPTRTPCTNASTTPMNANTNPIVDAVKPNLRFAEQRERRFESRERQRHQEIQREQQQQRRLGERVRNASMRPRRLRRRARPRAIPAAGTRRRRNWRSRAPTRTTSASRGLIRLSTPPSAGPKMNPRPNAAPTMPMPRARFSGVVMSAI